MTKFRVVERPWESRRWRYAVEELDRFEDGTEYWKPLGSFSTKAKAERMVERCVGYATGKERVISTVEMPNPAVAAQL